MYNESVYPVYAVPVQEPDGKKRQYDEFGLNTADGGAFDFMGAGMGANGGGGGGHDDTIDRSGSLFSQLDSMIAAVQNESSAVDSMRDKLKELDSLKAQVRAPHIH